MFAWSVEQWDLQQEAELRKINYVANYAMEKCLRHVSSEFKLKFSRKSF